MFTLSIKLFSKGECNLFFNPNTLHASGYHLPPSEYTVCRLYFSREDFKNDDKISLFRACEICFQMIDLLTGSIHMYNQYFCYQSELESHQ